MWRRVLAAGGLVLWGIAPAMAQQSAEYQQGLADRGAWEQWFSGLQGDYKTGAFYWAGQRSLPNPGSCRQMNADFYDSGMAAKGRLDPADALRKSTPDYRAGWNSYTAAPAPAASPLSDADSSDSSDDADDTAKALAK